MPGENAAELWNEQEKDHVDQSTTETVGGHEEPDPIEEAFEEVEGRDE